MYGGVGMAAFEDKQNPLLWTRVTNGDISAFLPALQQTDDADLQADAADHIIDAANSSTTVAQFPASYFLPLANNQKALLLAAMKRRPDYVQYSAAYDAWAANHGLTGDYTTTDAYKQEQTNTRLASVGPGGGVRGDLRRYFALDNAFWIEMPDMSGTFISSGDLNATDDQLTQLEQQPWTGYGHVMTLDQIKSELGTAGEPYVMTANGQVVPQSQAPAPPVPTGPPSGWRQGSLNGTVGWWGPDGLFHPGDQPWIDGTPGISINTAIVPSPSPTDTGAASGPSGGVVPVESGSGEPVGAAAGSGGGVMIAGTRVPTVAVVGVALLGGFLLLRRR